MGGWTRPCAPTRGLRGGVGLSATLENGSEEGWPEPHLAVSMAGSLALQLSLAPQQPHHCPLGPSRIGGEKVILLSASAWGFLTAVTPLLAHLGSAHLIFMTFSRILTGLLQGRHTSGASLTGVVRLGGVMEQVCAHVCIHAAGALCMHVCAPMCSCVWWVGSLD